MPEENQDQTPPIEIDYENIDVADIMRQIRERIASRPPAPEPPAIGGTATGEMPPPHAAPPPGPPGWKGRLKHILLKIMKPVSPLIKLAVLPVHHELRETILNLYQTNQRLDFLERKLDEQFSRLYQRLSDIDQATNRRVDLAFEDLNRAKEYLRLLHNLSHNLVVELTKLKIEEEDLKLKTRVMEKDFEFLGKREKALEKKVLE